MSQVLFKYTTQLNVLQPHYSFYLTYYAVNSFHFMNIKNLTIHRVAFTDKHFGLLITYHCISSVEDLCVFFLIGLANYTLTAGSDLILKCEFKCNTFITKCV